MKFALLVIALAHYVSCGNIGVRSSSLLSPAGVTYVDGSYHAGLAAGPVAYSAQPAYQSAAIAAAPAVAVASQPVAVAAAPVAYATQATKYAAIPTVQHVPGVADVPVTRIDAQQAVIQKTVDYARPAVKTQRYEVRRPAIQKQFYDIEERVVVRPAGSAVVELDEPLSRTQTGPSVVRPTGEAVPISASAAAVPAGPTVSTASAALPSVDINLARSSVAANAAANAAAAAAAAPVVPTVTAVSPAPAAFSSNFARSSFGAVSPIQSASFSGPAFVGQSVGVSAVPVKTVSVSAPVQTATISGVTSVSAGVSGISSVSAGAPGISFSTPAPQYQQQIIQSTPAPSFADDSVSVDSADFSLARSSGLARQGYQSGGFARQSFQAIQPQVYAAPSSVPTRETVFRSEFPPRRFTGQPTAASRSSLVVNYPNSIDLVPQTGFRAAATPVLAARSSQSEINHENQARLLQLLTARGGVTEIGYGRSGPASYPVDAGQVRARVLSATPAPEYAAPTGERVNTRRVVVSRPIETLQEVEVAEPVTKYERVRVDQPTVIKTASQDVVRVPTSVPVYGKTLAPIAEAPVAAYAAPAW